jgi:hypothetical protein
MGDASSCQRPHRTRGTATQRDVGPPRSMVHVSGRSSYPSSPIYMSWPDTIVINWLAVKANQPTLLRDAQAALASAEAAAKPAQTIERAHDRDEIRTAVVAPAPPKWRASMTFPSLLPSRASQPPAGRTPIGVASRPTGGDRCQRKYPLVRTAPHLASRNSVLGH